MFFILLYNMHKEEKGFSRECLNNKLLSVPEYSRMILQQHNGLKL